MEIQLRLVASKMPGPRVRMGEKRSGISRSVGALTFCPWETGRAPVVAKMRLPGRAEAVARSSADGGGGFVPIFPFLYARVPIRMGGEWSICSPQNRASTLRRRCNCHARGPLLRAETRAKEARRFLVRLAFRDSAEQVFSTAGRTRRTYLCDEMSLEPMGPPATLILRRRRLEARWTRHAAERHRSDPARLEPAAVSRTPQGEQAIPSGTQRSRGAPNEAKKCSRSGELSGGLSVRNYLPGC